jgi:hypothetical protein
LLIMLEEELSGGSLSTGFSKNSVKFVLSMNLASLNSQF